MWQGVRKRLSLLKQLGLSSRSSDAEAAHGLAEILLIPDDVRDLVLRRNFAHVLLLENPVELVGGAFRLVLLVVEHLDVNLEVVGPKSLQDHGGTKVTIVFDSGVDHVAAPVGEIRDLSLPDVDQASSLVFGVDS